MRQANGSETIYLRPEDELSTTRERLGQIAARRVILVVPVQTQLRTYIIWRALYAHARRLGKDVLVVSTDTQIRSAARGAKFQVSRSLNIAPANKPPRSPGRPTLRRSYLPETGEQPSAQPPTSDDDLTFYSNTFPPQPAHSVNADSLDYIIDDALSEEDEQPTIIHLPEPKERAMPERLLKPPKPLDMPSSTHVRIPPRRPHGTDDNEVSHSFATHRIPPRRTYLVPPPRRALSRKQLRGNEPFRFIVVTPLLLIGIYIVVRAVMEYVRRSRT